MKKIFVFTFCILFTCSAAHAGWFSKKKKSEEKVKSLDVSAQGRTLPQPKVPRPVDWESLQDAEKIMDKSVRFNKNKIGNVHPGMTRDEVQTILGDSVVIGYQGLDAPEGGTYQNILLKNPYRAEYLQGVGKGYEVFFYITDVKNTDGKVSGDELTPVIFEDDRLIGKDWMFYEKLRKQLKVKE